MTRRICVVTGSRAEYGLLYWLMRAIDEDPDLKLQLVVTGMHLSPEFGLTYREIERDGFQIDKKIEILLSSDTPMGVSKALGLGVIGMTDALAELQPDLLVLLGDRFEMFAAAVAATASRLPIAHIHGGESTEGAVDEAFRHSTTKMAWLHFAATDAYRKRIIQMGENPERVFNVGGLGIDNIKKLSLLDCSQIEDELGIKMQDHNFLITFHPATLENESTEIQFQILLEALETLPDTQLIFTRPNADAGSRVLIDMLDDYVARHHERAAAFCNLGQRMYLSVMRQMDGVIGNSSSGIIEAPSFHIGTINIGNRQEGRIKADSVIDCRPSRNEIIDALKRVISDEFQKQVQSVKNPYGEGGAAEKIVVLIKRDAFSGSLMKRFFDIPIEDRYLEGIK